MQEHSMYASGHYVFMDKHKSIFIKKQLVGSQHMIRLVGRGTTSYCMLVRERPTC